MNALKLNFHKAVLGLWLVGGFVACTDEQLDNPTNDPVEAAIPTQFSIDIPSAISSVRVSKDTKTAVIDGNDLYNHLNTFIAVTEGAADIVEGVMQGIGALNAAGISDMTFQSPDDNKQKRIVVTENAEYEMRQWQHKLEMTDIEYVEAGDGVALQVFWNTNPVEGIAVLRPKYFDRNASDVAENTMIKVQYSEKPSDNHQQSMLVSIANWPLEEPTQNLYSLNNLKMFVTKNQTTINVVGNTNHPNAQFYTSATGFQWAFVASANSEKNIAVAEVGLPRSTETAESRQVLLVDNSINQVFSNQIAELYPNATQQQIEAYLVNTLPPAFFNSNGFIQGQNSPSDDYSVLTENIKNLTPYKPVSIAELTIAFQ